MRNWFLALVMMLGISAPALAHCDTMDGPVVKAGLAALESDRPELALVWVPETREAELRAAFDRAREPEGQRAFLETLVRIHREGEGEAYEGLKPAGTAIPAPVAALDRALETGSPAGLDPEVREAYELLQPLRGYPPLDLAAGRRYVAAYVETIHRLEGPHAEEPGHEGCGR